MARNVGVHTHARKVHVVKHRMIGIKRTSIGIESGDAALENALEQLDRIATGFAGLSHRIGGNPQATGDEVGAYGRSTGQSIRRHRGRGGQILEAGTQETLAIEHLDEVGVGQRLVVKVERTESGHRRGNDGTVIESTDEKTAHMPAPAARRVREEQFVEAQRLRAVGLGGIAREHQFVAGGVGRAHHQVQRVIDLRRCGPLDIAHQEVEGRATALGQVGLIQALSEGLLGLVEHRIERDDDDREQTHGDHQLQQRKRSAATPRFPGIGAHHCARLNKGKVHRITGHPAGTGRSESRWAPDFPEPD